VRAGRRLRNKVRLCFATYACWAHNLLHSKLTLGRDNPYVALAQTA
jgi:hypothetical protein